MPVSSICDWQIQVRSAAADTWCKFELGCDHSRLPKGELRISSARGPYEHCTRIAMTWLHGALKSRYPVAF